MELLLQREGVGGEEEGIAEGGEGGEGRNKGETEVIRIRGKWSESWRWVG